MNSGQGHLDISDVNPARADVKLVLHPQSNQADMKSKKIYIPLLYTIAGICWILLSDKAMLSIAGDLDSGMLTTFSIVKGTLFIAITAGLLYVLLGKFEDKIQDNVQLEDTLNSISVSFFTLNKSWVITRVNANFYKCTGIQSDVRGKTLEELFPGSGDSPIFLGAKQAMETQIAARVEAYYEPLGKWFKVVHYPTKEGISVYFTDITAERETTNQVRRSALQIRQQGEILDKIHNPVVISDPQGIITWVNAAFVRRSGYSEAECVGHSHADLLYGPKTDWQTVYQLIAAVARREAFNGELLLYMKSKAEYWVSINLSPIYNDAGELESYISVENDITERKEKEAKIGQQSEQLRNVSWLNSHQIRKPVASILSLVQLLKISTDKKEQVHMLEALRECAEELDGIIHKINEEASADGPT